MSAILALAIAANATLPPDLSQALSPPADVEVATYQVTLTDDEDIDWVATVDPSQPVGNRIDVHAPAKPEWPEGAEEVIAEFDAGADGDIWCDSMADMIGAAPTQISASETAQVWQFRPNLPEDADKSDKAFAKVAKGEVHIARAEDGPWQISKMRMWIEKPFKPVFIAKVSSFNLEIECAPTPEGRMYQAKSETRVEGSAMGRRFEEIESLRISNVLTRR